MCGNPSNEAVAAFRHEGSSFELAREGGPALSPKERLMLELLNTRAGAYVGATELLSLAFGIFDPPLDRAGLERRMRDIQSRCAAAETIEQDPQRGYRLAPQRS